MTSPIKTTDREDRVDAMWALDDNERRLAIVRRASAGARKTLAAKL